MDPNMYAEHTFSFDYIYSEESSQEEVYANTAKDSVLSVLEGYNSTILAYGQTGTGKTYTMEGRISCFSSIFELDVDLGTFLQ